VAHEKSQKSPDLSSLTPEQLAEELRSLTEQTDAIVNSTGFLRFTPLKYQLPWYEAENEIRPVVAPNQQGKTTWGAIETISGCTGMRPIALGGKDQARPQRGSKRGYRALVSGESFDALRDNVLPKFSEFISPGMLQGPPKKNAEGFPYLWRFATGAEAVFMSYQQDVSVFEGAVWDRAWFDEPPPQAIFNAVRRGLMARRGRVDLSLTPLKEAWILDELISRGVLSRITSKRLRTPASRKNTRYTSRITFERISPKREV
jgi:phage terminase large subunit-like protein